ncbi:hypothetical protein [Nocardiopsis flavescens]
MAAPLIAMRWRLLGRSLRGARAAWVAALSLAGLGCAAVAAVLAADASHSGRTGLAVAFAVWGAGWLVVPLVGIGGRDALKPEHFARHGLTHRRLSAGLLGASMVGAGFAVTVLFFGTLAVAAAPLGPAALAVAVAAAVLTAVVALLGSKIVAATLAETMHTRTGAVLASLPWAVVAAAASNGAVLLVAVGRSGFLGGRWPAWLDGGVRSVPSGWGVGAVEAAGRGDVLGALTWVLALAGLGLALFSGWARFTRRRSFGPVGRTRHARALPVPAWADSLAGGSLVKESRAWARDPLRLYHWFFALWFALVYCAIPVLAGTTAYLPWAGVVFGVLAAAGAANLYGIDGTALWLTLMRPGRERADVRVRQAAWLLTTAPVAIALTGAGLALDGPSVMAAWVVPVLVVVLGAGAGLVVAISVRAPVAVPDAHRRTTPAEDAGNTVGLVWAVIGLLAAAVAPSLALTAAGVLGWPPGAGAGLVCAAVTAVAAWWGPGRLAARRLERRGPELLDRLAGRAPSRTAARTAAPDPRSDTARVALGLSLGAGWTPIAMGVLSLVTVADGSPSSTAWTLPARLPAPWAVLCALCLIAVGVFVYARAGRLVWSRIRSRPDR